MNTTHIERGNKTKVLVTDYGVFTKSMDKVNEARSDLGFPPIKSNVQ
ncbi:MAG: hypothetical protein R3321_07490 [Nitrososphaeraceae archaeon]|nr:hypothetical protein [Nitrososphaeraceae archaeon]